MGVDGIGKGGGVPPVGTDAVVPVQGTDLTEPAPAANPVAEVARPEPSAALEQLRRGEIDAAAYLDARAAAAVAHLEGRLPVDQLEAVRGALREQLETDPVLVELVRRATAGASNHAR